MNKIVEYLNIKFKLAFDFIYSGRDGWFKDVLFLPSSEGFQPRPQKVWISLNSEASVGQLLYNWPYEMLERITLKAPPKSFILLLWFFSSS